MIRPNLFVDTNVCIKVANGTIPADEWRRVQQHIESNYNYYISFVTMKELLGKLARGRDDYFEQNKKPLKILLGPGKPMFLPYPAVFALRTILGLSISRKHEHVSFSDEEWAETLLATVLQAPSKAQLKSGIPLRNRAGQKVWFDLDHFDQHENEPQREFANILEGIRDDRNDMPEPMTWAAWILHPFGFPPYTDQCKKLHSALDAAYAYTCTLSRMTKNMNYNFHAHETNWGDACQLFYLCEEPMFFLTFDGKCRTHASPSTQASRILVYREFVQSLP